MNQLPWWDDDQAGDFPNASKNINFKSIGEGAWHVLSFYDLIWSMTREQLWAWHGARYYRWSKNIFDITLKSWKLNSITEMQAHEFFAHLNEAYFMNNEIIKEILPEIYKAMKDFYKSIWFDPFI